MPWPRVAGLRPRRSAGAATDPRALRGVALGVHANASLAVDLLPGVDVEWSVPVDDRNVTLETPVSGGKRILESSLSGTIQRSARTVGRAPAGPARAAGGGARRIERFAR